MNSLEDFFQENVRFERSRTADRRSYVTLACERGGAVKKYTKPIVDDEEKEIPIKRRDLMGLKKCGHNHKIVVYDHGHAQAAKLTEEQLQRTEHSRRVMCRLVISYDFFENKMLVVQLGKNTVKKVLCLSAQRGYTVFYRNREESNILSDIVVAHPTSIAMIRMLPHVLIMDTTYKTNK
ncbi:hypothetical protein M9H77_28953 [Catharanthus roseus]|uniref:Uncharacterized protein n=1 Tax=Catharanthus roseus TaxID=4058 RepID=A0ACC0AH26_CATRO|nr:hypothetical protein M9H77_28953 [Catharanthus roseus]